MAGSWQVLTNQAPFGVSTMVLLTNGQVLAFQGGGKEVWRLRPNVAGSYRNGTWSQMAPMHNTRLYFGSAVLADGRVLVMGGEYSDAGSDTTACEIYDPVLNQWATVTPPTGWTQVGDAPCAVLPDGRVILGSIGTTKTAIFNPTTNAFTAGPTKHDQSAEETWTLLPDETILSAECVNHPKAEKYVAASNTWVSAGVLPVELVQASSSEIGPAVLLPDGRVFATGATGNTALYTPPPIASQAGSWTAGPTFPAGTGGLPLEAKDAPACLLPNGRVLCAVSPAAEGGTFPGPTEFFEYESGSLNGVASPTNATGPTFAGRMLLTPTGEVLYSDGSATVSIYAPDGAPDDAWRPVITACPWNLRQKQSYMLYGRQLNGLSQACAYGDDATMATNYPLIRITSNSGAVHYCRTFDHSTMGVATGLSIQSTHFKVPFGVANGPARLEVVANGIASHPIDVFIGAYQIQVAIDELMFNRLIGSLADGPLWVLGKDGPHPVDPWGPDIARKARIAWDAIVKGAEALRELGREVDALQEKVAAERTRAAAPHKQHPHSMTGHHH